MKSQLQQSNSIRKHVQFPDELNLSDSDNRTIINDANGNGQTINSQSGKYYVISLFQVDQN